MGKLKWFFLPLKPIKKKRKKNQFLLNKHWRGSECLQHFTWASARQQAEQMWDSPLSKGQNVLPPPGKWDKIALRGAGRADSEGFIGLCSPGLKNWGVAPRGTGFPVWLLGGTEDKKPKINLKWDLKAGASTFFDKIFLSTLCKLLLWVIFAGSLQLFAGQSRWVLVLVLGVFGDPWNTDRGGNEAAAPAQLGHPNPFIWIYLIYCLDLT